MSRSPVSLRAAPDDAPPRRPVDATCSAGPTRRTRSPTSSSIIKAARSPREQRLVVAEYDGEPAGAVHLRPTTLSPLNLEPVVQALSPHVLAAVPPARRRPGADGGRGGVRRGARHRPRADRRRRPAPATPTGSWPGSRSARTPSCGWRRPTVVRSKLTAQRPPVDPAASGRPLGQVLAAAPLAAARRQAPS